MGTAYRALKPLFLGYVQCPTPVALVGGTPGTLYALDSLQETHFLRDETLAIVII
ncbi:hypothetical protein [uncultured Nostoc sp.]|uniref:hypothetical protein n=1 Tax=uncultured Nostoc sp. TaxID=340711 RepID=UPI002621D564|nr:hypothetical protein [uncultured Nostoc sp.]